MILPIILPMHTESPKCQNCGQNEDKKTVCRHCGSEYVSEPTTWFEKIIFTIIVVFILWLGITIIIWFLNNLIGESRTLWEQIKSSLDLFTSLKLW